MIRQKEKDKNFIEALKSPLKPTNDTSPSPEMEDYLKKMNDGTLLKEKKEPEKPKKRRMICPVCHKGELKRTPQGGYCCGQCGLTSNSPAYITE